MAGLIGHLVNSADVALTAATARTVLQVTAPTNHRLMLEKFSLSCKGVSTTGTPITVVIMRQTSAGSGGGAVTPQKHDPSYDETLQATALEAPTSEPTSSTILRRFFLHPQDGHFETLTERLSLPIPGGTRLGIVCTAPEGVSVAGEMEYEE